jgi:hypothetical protein
LDLGGRSFLEKNAFRSALASFSAGMKYVPARSIATIRRSRCCRLSPPEEGNS